MSTLNPTISALKDAELPSLIDLFLFMGQSNMAGRGIISPIWPQPAPILLPGAGYEYRAITAPDRLIPICEPFGIHENISDGIDDKEMKTGSLISSFTNQYYSGTGIPLVGISASKGGSSILQWQPKTPFLSDALNRLAKARQFLTQNHIQLRHTFLLWCQGETDGDHGMSETDYCRCFYTMWNALKAAGIEHCFLIQIGNYNGTAPYDYSEIQQAQKMLSTRDDILLVSEGDFASMQRRGLMKDEFHYYQAAYNEVGAIAGRNTAEYVRNLTN